MAIMHTTLTGTIISDPVIYSDSEGAESSCTFTMHVKENERILFNVYVCNKEQIELCRDELVRGSVAVVKGIIEISFHNISQGRKFSDGKSQVHTVLFSDMTILSEDLHILLGHSYQRNLSMLPIRSSEKVETEEYQFDPEVELPF